MLNYKQTLSSLIGDLLSTLISIKVKSLFKREETRFTFYKKILKLNN